SHWEFTLKINTTIVCYPSPTEPVYSVAQLLCIVSISLDGTIIAIEHLPPPPCGANPTTTTTTETTTPDYMDPIVPLIAAGAAIGSVVIIVFVYVKKQK
ncbi:MAG: hypothetical protein KGY80_14270, partial [Candidatus Thorarchaeota archaeon]|nr:hypothetical protein [Candidatus Thorarchaeota archaeon]